MAAPDAEGSGIRLAADPAQFEGGVEAEVGCVRGTRDAARQLRRDSQRSRAEFATREEVVAAGGVTARPRRYLFTYLLGNMSGPSRSLHSVMMPTARIMRPVRHAQPRKKLASPPSA